ncbi:JAB domain-containing protein [Allosphingosinicella indica]|uniref:JAB domain-containing protein n=1 Tax=Allosphingosinicella indica TaxID=941907 RepID=UPI001560FFE0|nr:JAB domain-containing protein [Allosphingosinicella indica]
MTEGRAQDVLDLCATIHRHALRHEALSRPIIGSSEALAQYLKLEAGFRTVETLCVLFLAADNRLIDEGVIAWGAVDSAHLPIRAILQRALDCAATGLILVHNHPSGDPEPSRADIEATCALVEAARTFDLRLVDHVIVARAGWTSLRARGLC